MTHVGSRNSPDGLYTIRDDSLPHQIRLTRSTGGNVVRVSCNCGRVMGDYDTGAADYWLDQAWQAYDEHTMEET